MKQHGVTVCGIVSVAMLTLTLLPTGTQAVPLDEFGEMRLGVRAYVNARIGTENTDLQITRQRESLTWPISPAGHLRQNRFFVEAEYHHDLKRLVKGGLGPLELLNHLPFKVRGLAYHLTFRGEYDGIYDWGPREYRSSSGNYIMANSREDAMTRLGKDAWSDFVLLPNPIAGPSTVDPNTGELVCLHAPATKECYRLVDRVKNQRTLRDRAVHRERLFQAYVEGTVGDLFMRLGRQVWSWGETDGFRLLDQINPIDSSFGGFLISLDERRVPLDMLRTEYRIGHLGPFSEVAIHAYGAIDNKVGFKPGTPLGSPWTLPNAGKPNNGTTADIVEPKRTFRDIRGGGRLVWNFLDATFSVAHYYTYFDKPMIQSFVVPGNPRATLPSDRQGFPLKTWDDGANAHGLLTPKLVQVSGATTTFAVPQLYAVVRSELAYFKDEPRYQQEQIDPFVYRFRPGACNDPAQPCTGGTSAGDSWNFVLGLDVNQYVRFINPHQTLFISTQFFYKHMRGAVESGKEPVDFGARNVRVGEVLPIPQWSVDAVGLGRVEPIYVREPRDQFLHTLFINTSFMSGQLNTSFSMFYDWGGAFVYQPSLTIIHDPWRFGLSWSIMDASSLKGGSGVSLLRDRDNVEFRLEYAI